MLLTAILAFAATPTFADDGATTTASSATEVNAGSSGRVLYYHGRVVWRTGLRAVRHANGSVAFDTKSGNCFDLNGAPVEADRCSVSLVDGSTMSVRMTEEEGLVISGLARPHRELQKLQGPTVAYSGS